MSEAPRKEVETTDAAPRGLGAAVDLGTTEIRLSLWNLDRAQCIDRILVPNPQVRLGSDVLARLSRAVESASGAREMSELAGGAIAQALRAICSKNSLAHCDVRSVVVVGNTAMLALLTGLGCADLLTPEGWRHKIECQFESPRRTCASWGLQADCNPRVVQPIAGFVGSDLLAGMVATRLTDGPAGSLLIDFGANTEIALWDGATIWATSAAGGPAFERCGVHSGLSARDGAIRHVARDAETGQFALDVIGNAKPKGICASGLVDAVACLLEAGQLSVAGRFSGDARKAGFVALTDEGDVLVTRQDVDTLQRAKAGVAAATQCLLATAGLTIADIGRVCVAGAFGSGLDIGNAHALGLLPPVKDRAAVELHGNTAIAGCEAILLGAPGVGARERELTTVVSMSYSADYEETLIRNLLLRPWDFSSGPFPAKEGADARRSRQSV